MGSHRIITLRNGTRVDMSTGEIISQGRPDYVHRPHRSFWQRLGDGLRRVFSFLWSVVAFILSAIVFIWKGIGYIIIFGGLLGVIVTFVSTWISDGFFSALVAGFVAFIVWSLVVGVACKLGMIDD